MSSALGLAEILSAAYDADERDLLREDALEAIPIVAPEITLRIVHYDPSEDDCGIEGHYDEATRTITVGRAASRRRTWFTALHELGHDRARRHPDVARAIAQLSADAGRRYEEDIANAFAATILIPDDVLDTVMGDRQPTAVAVAELFGDDRVHGSREACCVRVAQRMRGNGYVILAEGSTVRFCAVVGDTYRVARGTVQDRGHLLERAAQHGLATDNDVVLRHRSGATTPPFAGQAVTDGAYVFAVLTDATNPPWGGWVPPRDSRPTDGPPEMWCDECDEIVEAWQRCDNDPRHRVCGVCGWCACRTPRRKLEEKVCQQCTQSKHIALFDEHPEICRDCL